MSGQFPMPLAPRVSYRREDFIVSPVNARALAAVEAWPGWRDGALALTGPEGSGKSHLASIWRDRAGETGVLLEDVDRAPAGEALFHRLNAAAAGGASVLLTGRTPPAAWPTDLPDLRSRLAALPVAELEEPDDALLRGVLIKLFKERAIRPAPELIEYLVRRIDRSIPAAADIVRRLDERASAEAAPVSRTLARRLLEEAEATGDLFPPGALS